MQVPGKQRKDDVCRATVVTVAYVIERLGASTCGRMTS